MSIEERVTALVADEKRAFVLTRLVETTPRLSGYLEKKFDSEYPAIAAILSPWPSNSSRISALCGKSLNRLGFTDAKETVINTHWGTRTVYLWYATEEARQVRDYVDFAFAMSNEFDISLFSLFGQLVGPTIKSPHLKAKLLLYMADIAKPGSPTRILNLPCYSNKNTDNLSEFIEHYASIGLAYIAPFEGGSSSRICYQWADSVMPTKELARKLRGKLSYRFLSLMKTLYLASCNEGVKALPSDQLALESGYSQISLERVLGVLMENGFVEKVSKYALRDVEITPKCEEIVNRFIRPFLGAMGGNVWDRAYVRGIAESFRHEPQESLKRVMERFSATPHPGYRKG